MTAPLLPDRASGAIWSRWLIFLHNTGTLFSDANLSEAELSAPFSVLPAGQICFPWIITGTSFLYACCTHDPKSLLLSTCVPKVSHWERLTITIIYHEGLAGNRQDFD